MSPSVAMPDTHTNGFPASSDTKSSPIPKTAANGAAIPNGHSHGSQISELAESIASNTAIVDKYLEANGLPQPSFDEDGPVDFGLSPEVEAARLAALEASTLLSDLLRGPSELLTPTVSTNTVSNDTPLHSLHHYPSNPSPYHHPKLNLPPDQRHIPRSHLQIPHRPSRPPPRLHNHLLPSRAMLPPRTRPPPHFALRNCFLSYFSREDEECDIAQCGE